MARFEDPEIPFATPRPIPQAALYRSAAEIPGAVAASASGASPAWLAGTLLRNGPGLFEFGEEAATHAVGGARVVSSTAVVLFCSLMAWR